MPLKVHFLDSHLDKFKQNKRAYSEEQGKQLHQELLNFEYQYQRQYNKKTMETVCLIQERDLQDG